MAEAPATLPHGRPISITPHRASKLLQALAAGNYLKTSCNYAGVSYQTARNWVRMGEQEIERARPVLDARGVDVDDFIQEWLEKNPADRYQPTAKALTARAPKDFDKHRWPCVVFATLLVKAEAQAEARAVNNVISAGQNSWQAAMTYLERKYPERWGRRDRMQMEGTPGGAPIQVQNVPSTDELLTKVLTLAAQAPTRNELEAPTDD